MRSSGRGVVHSFAVHHHPPVPGFDYPLTIGLIDLEEGTRLVSNIVGAKPSEIEIGMRVEVFFEDFGDDVVLPQFRPS